MEVAGLALAVVAFVPPIIQGLQQLKSMIEQHKGLPQEWQERSIRLDLCRHELEYLTYPAGFAGRHNRALAGGLQVMQQDIQTLSERLDRNRSRLRGLPAAMLLAFVEPQLQGILQKVDSWLAQYSRLLLIDMHRQLVVVAPAPITSNPPTTVGRLEQIYREAAAISTSPDPVVTTLQLQGDKIELNDSLDIMLTRWNNVPVLVEKRSINSPTDERAMLIQLLRRLRETNPTTMHVLQALGLIETSGSFYMIFGLPKQSRILHTLRSQLLLDSGRARHPLNERLKLAMQIATGLFYLHAAGYVHKNIMPEAILLFQPAKGLSGSHAYDEGRKLGDAYVAGYVEIRRKEAPSYNPFSHQSFQLDHRVYQHPERQFNHLRKYFTMLHDVYSLGVVLVEIALWRSLILKGDYQEKLIDLAKNEVPQIMGSTYAGLALECLTATDNTSGTIFGLTDDDVMDKNGTGKVAQCYSGKVVEILEGLCL